MTGIRGRINRVCAHCANDFSLLRASRWQSQIDSLSHRKRTPRNPDEAIRHTVLACEPLVALAACEVGECVHESNLSSNRH